MSALKLGKKLYRELWWWQNDFREARFVARALKLAEGHRVTYIHPDGKKPAKAAIVRIEDLPVEVGWDHSHVEGR